MSDIEIGYANDGINLKDYRFPTSALMVPEMGDYVNSTEFDTVYGYTCSRTLLITKAGQFFVKEGMYFCVPSPMKAVSTGEGRNGNKKGSILIIVRHKYRGVFSIGGPIEEKGRLRYIDGCSDSLLLPPPRLGDPCLNFLHFPKNINQTMHTHPSVRIGVVARGAGVCQTPEGEFDLVPGMLWFLPEGKPHKFMTKDDTMDVIAWHPETDTGPNDEDHPMINRTIVNGASANKMWDIKTQGEIRNE